MAEEVKTKRKPTLKQKKAVDNLVGNGGNVTKAMRDAGYSEATINTPQKLTESAGFKALLDEILPDKDVVEKHKELLNSTRVEHMVFPTYNTEKASELKNKQEKTGEDMTDEIRKLMLTDEEITELLSEVNCKVRKIVHGETARHVYFWSADNKARKEAIALAYKMKGVEPKNGGGVIMNDPQINILIEQAGKILNEENRQDIEALPVQE